ncbi:TPA: tRNA (guanosine(37)-N1)-methyltransferase TrmD [Candidatus Falkowbacteria bacterium]|nr:tRNA (guanosine(37)-N1)-methyltransferase TrmD [Candidatus Falkowbacteria bacterium]HAY12159.1 tRNA (guanosine(37)-N1)-methyltransferase TrmD [Candidatus Falkowbacteria bacterium]HBI97320.1 tRNA (guanosine(37)-N1)-methyltransferase TrmD [Candidatus Falkowbacteria bacterium]HBT28063.1 tRNA (guanosine(37)-N1)-methyltransferase TrmD [Candidatus Falkowbacteria bacterium]HBY14527.1 tRNA (guanosine(37)-N1)-methyltransferase TrmD [Candidatus Falkowbacteria bacterium]
MTFNIITIFPEIFNSYFNESILKRAQEQGNIKINIINLRDYTTDKHKTVDDTPYGGGAGMVMKVDILYKTVSSIKYQVLSNNIQPELHNTKYLIPNTKIILLSAKGQKWNQQKAKEYANLENITLVCGRYEGVDERITEFIDEEISIGDYVLTGGEIGAMALVDSITRLLPGVLGNEQSAQDESHSIPGELEYPQYTRPEVFIDSNSHEHKVPEVLLSGNHAEIEKWRRSNKGIRYLGT